MSVHLTMSNLLHKALVSLCFALLFPTVSVKADNQDAILLDQIERAEFPELLSYESKVKAALASEPPVLNLLPLTVNGQQILKVALGNADFISKARDTSTKKPMRNEIFAVRPFRAGDLSHDSSKVCAANNCFTVEMYNFTAHITSYAVVLADTLKILGVRHLNSFQPEIPEHLRELAIQIARNTKEVRSQLAEGADLNSFIMAGTKTALNRTRCERAQHLCVAPTFVLNKRALWTIVDLEEGRVVGTRFTEWQNTAPIAFTEQKLRDEIILEKLCENSVTMEQAGWKLRYQLTSSDGLEVQDVSYKGSPRLKSAKNVDWHVSYSDNDGFGYSDAIGCPLFSAAAVVPAKLPKIKPLMDGEKTIGFELHQDFLSKQWPLPCNYYYEQRFQFFNDGRFRIAVASVGRGCGVPGIYRPVIRMELPFNNSTVSSFTDNGWKTWDKEGFVEQTKETKYSTEGYQFKIQASNGEGYYLEPGRAQFDDKGRGDNAFTYIVRNHPEREEGARDLPTIGPCCNDGYQQGPEKFIDDKPEQISNSSLVMWYVPQLMNDGRPGSEYCWGSTDIVDGKVVKYEYPCIAGPMFVPFSNGTKASK